MTADQISSSYFNGYF